MTDLRVDLTDMTPATISSAICLPVHTSNRGSEFPLSADLRVGLTDMRPDIQYLFTGAIGDPSSFFLCSDYLMSELNEL